MSATETKAIYIALLECGDLRKLFPSMTGTWEEDEKSFTKEYNKNERDLEDLEIGDFEEDFGKYY